MEIKVRGKCYRIPWEYVLAPLLVLLILLVLLLTNGALHRESPVGYVSSETPKVLPDKESVSPSVPSSLPQTTSETSPTPEANQQPSDSSTININTATMEELMTLPYIGEVKAKAILEYRNAYGPFKSVEELLNVKGIGEKTLEKLRPLVKVE